MAKYGNGYVCYALVARYRSTPHATRDAGGRTSLAFGGGSGGYAFVQRFSKIYT